MSRRDAKYALEIATDVRVTTESPPHYPAKAQGLRSLATAVELLAQAVIDLYAAVEAAGGVTP